MAQHPEARFVLDGKAYTFGDRQYQEDYEKEAKQKFSQITGIPLEHLETGHSKEGMYDEAAELNIAVSGIGEKNGTYRFVADKNGNYWIERQVDGGWARDEKYPLTAGQTAEAARNEAAIRQGKLQAERDRAAMQKAFDQLEKEKDPEWRLALVGSLALKVGEDELWKIGVNPNTGEELKTMPAYVWDRILNAMTASQRAEQEAEWQRMGIRRGGGK
jgi:hypothetical protein